MPYDPTKTEERLLVVTDTFAALIAASAYLVSAPAVPVLTERKGDIANEIAKALNGLGLAVVVVLADGETQQVTGNKTGLRVRLVAEISENVLINQAKATAANVPYRPALGAAVAAMKAVDRKANGLDPAGQPHRTGLNEFELSEAEPIRLVPATRPTYHVTAYTTVLL
jgi:hypothetical protein